MNTNELLYWLDGYLTDKKEGLGGEQVKIIREKITKIINPVLKNRPVINVSPSSTYLKPFSQVDSWDELNISTPLC